MTAGGKRPGSGRKTNEEKGLPTLISKSFRVDAAAFNKAHELYGRKLNGKINAYLKRLAKKDK